MSLIIYYKTQQVSFQRFAVSVLSGTVFLLALGMAHAWLHNTGSMLKLDVAWDVRLIFIAAAIGILLTVIYFYYDGPGAWSQETAEKSTPKQLEQPQGYEHSGNIRRLFAYMIGGNMLMLAMGLHVFVWQPAGQSFDFVRALGNIALANMALFLPLNYAVLLKLDVYCANSSEELCAFAQERFYQILYWVLVAYWACIFAAYLILLAYSQPYCHLLAC